MEPGKRLASRYICQGRGGRGERGEREGEGGGEGGGGEGGGEGLHYAVVLHMVKLNECALVLNPVFCEFNGGGHYFVA